MKRLIAASQRLYEMCKQQQKENKLKIAQLNKQARLNYHDRYIKNKFNLRAWFFN